MSVDDTAFKERQRLAESMRQVRVGRASFALYGSLKKQTQLCILRNKFFFELACLQRNENPFNKISNSMKKELMELQAEIEENENTEEENIEEAQLQCKVQQLLLNKEITSFHFAPGLNLYAEDLVTELWQSLLAIQPPNLHTIVCKCSKDESWDVRPFFNSLLPCFPNLEVLRLDNFNCNNQDLITISDHLPKLRVLEVETLDGVYRAGFVALRRLTTLQELLFSNVNHNGLLIRQCLELLPQLHSIAIKLTPRSYSLDTKDVLKIGEALSQIRSPCTLQLRHLVISAMINMDRVFMNISLPELRSLYLCYYLEMDKWFAGGLPKLSELYVYDTIPEDLLFILGHVGQQLQTLHFSCSYYMPLDRVLNACPNVSDLCVKNYESPEFDESQLQPDTLKSLQKVVLEMFLDNTWLLLKILRRATQLKSIDLRMVKLEDEDWKGWAKLAEEGICMQNLQKIKLQFYDEITEQLDKHLIEEMFTSCSLHCPQLQSCSVDYEYEPSEF